MMPTRSEVGCVSTARFLTFQIPILIGTSRKIGVTFELKCLTDNFGKLMNKGTLKPELCVLLMEVVTFAVRSVPYMFMIKA